MALTKFRRWISGDPASHAAGEAEPPSSPPLAAGARLNTRPPPVIPNLRLLRCIGRGAYGEVWLARDEIAVHLALKLIYKDTFPDRSPFEREYRGILHYTPLSRTHHGLVQILHVGRPADAGFFYYVMELADCAVSGREIDPDFYIPRTLAHELDTRGRLPVRESLTLALELSEALNYLHSRQLIHRDIKPANIIYVNGVAKLADVGLVTHMAEARRDPKHLGTEGFVPPEGPGTPTADVYSLGKVLTETCLGHAALKDPHVAVTPAAGESPAELEQFRAIIAHACDEDVDRRCPSVQDFEAELMAFHDSIRSGPR
jgi:serine/threonine protein kinase